MSGNDTFQKFLFDDLHIRGEWVRLGSSFHEALGGRNYHPTVKELLAQTAAASVLLTGTLKFEGLLSIHARGSGPVNLLMAESNEKKQFRCLANYSEQDVHSSKLSELLGQAQLAITIDPARGQRYQGIVPLEKASIADCLAHYFELSEQLDTHFVFHMVGDQVHALMLQKLPEYRDAEDQDAWNRVVQLANTLSPEEWRDADNRTLTMRLFHEEQVALFDAEEVSFKCSCSRARSLASIESLGVDEALEILETEAVIAVDCQFCNTHYEFDRSDINTLFKLGKAH